ncbi:MAG: hypothetical protein R6U43_11835 [Candidatus Krumholzibacteriales bacterium]
MKSEKLIHKLAGTVVIAVAAGITGAGLLKLFMKALDYLSARTAAVTVLPGFLVPVAGAALTGLVILRYFPGAGGDGTNSYIEAVNNGSGSFRGVDTFFAVTPGTVNYSAVLCASISAILSSALNIPIAAALIAVAIFDHSYIIPAAASAILPFFIFRSRTVFAYPGEELADKLKKDGGAAGN